MAFAWGACGRRVCALTPPPPPGPCGGILPRLERRIWRRKKKNAALRGSHVPKDAADGRQVECNSRRLQPGSAAASRPTLPPWGSSSDLPADDPQPRRAIPQLATSPVGGTALRPAIHAVACVHTACPPEGRNGDCLPPPRTDAPAVGGPVQLALRLSGAASAGPHVRMPVVAPHLPPHSRRPTDRPALRTNEPRLGSLHPVRSLVRLYGIYLDTSYHT